MLGPRYFKKVCISTTCSIINIQFKNLKVPNFLIMRHVLRAICLVSITFLRFPCRGFSISVPYTKTLWYSNRLFARLSHKKFGEPNCCCMAPDGRKHVELKKIGINKVSLSRNWFEFQKLYINLQNHECDA